MVLPMAAPCGLQSCARTRVHTYPQTTAPHPTPPHPRYADDYSPVRLAALARSKVSIERLEESDLDYATSAASLASLRGRLKAAIANFQGCSGEYVDFVKKVGRAGEGAGCRIGLMNRE